jgi:hypothetical protein
MTDLAAVPIGAIMDAIGFTIVAAGTHTSSSGTSSGTAAVHVSLANFWPALAVLILFAVFCFLASAGKPGTLVEGADGRASTSKLQFLLWTAVILTSYVAILLTRFWISHHVGVVETELPVNVLIAMGFSATTAVAAKGITVSYIGNGQVAKASAGTTLANNLKAVATGPGAIFQDDDGIPDLSKIQMMLWTVVAIGIYIMRVVAAINAAASTPPTLPDIEPAFLVLMGLGQGAYLGKKLTTTTTPRLTGLSPASASAAAAAAANPPVKLTLTGLSLTLSGADPSNNNPQDEQGDGMITIDGNPVNVSVASWSDSQIVFTLQQRSPDGGAWQPGQRINIGMIVGGQASANTLPFSFTAP